jgi:hypothetical protein
MKLIELKPRWYSLEPNGPHVGMTFLCPHCHKERLGILLCRRGRQAMIDDYIKARHGRKGYIWTVVGSEDFLTLTLTPSIDASLSGHWHGFITNGEIR